MWTLDVGYRLRSEEQYETLDDYLMFVAYRFNLEPIDSGMGFGIRDVHLVGRKRNCLEAVPVIERRFGDDLVHASPFKNEKYLKERVSYKLWRFFEKVRYWWV